jgi:hypothetical protein
MRMRLTLTSTVGFALLCATGAPGGVALFFDVTNTDDEGPGSLRQALTDAQGNPGESSIGFVIPGPGPHVIRPLSSLPPLNSPDTFVDGSTQLAPGGSPLVVLDGASAEVNAAGLRLAARDCAVRGLEIRSWQGAAIMITGEGARRRVALGRRRRAPGRLQRDCLLVAAARRGPSARRPRRPERGRGRSADTPEYCVTDPVKLDDREGGSRAASSARRCEDYSSVRVEPWRSAAYPRNCTTPVDVRCACHRALDLASWTTTH